MSLITSLRDVTFVPGVTDKEKLGPIVGCIVMDRDVALLSLLALELVLGVVVLLSEGACAVLSISTQRARLRHFSCFCLILFYCTELVLSDHTRKPEALYSYKQANGSGITQTKLSTS